MRNELELMNLHVNVLFQHNHAMRITKVNEPPYDEAPRFFLGSTKRGVVARYLDMLREDVVLDLEQIVATEAEVDLAKVITVLHREQPVQNISFGPAYVFPAVDAERPRAVEITQLNKELLKPNFPYTHDELNLKQPCFAIVEDGMAVSVCCSARQTTVAAEASVYTLEKFRGRGYGVEVTLAWAKTVQGEGRCAMYSTVWDNYASQAVAKKLQLVQYGTDFHIS